MNLHPLTEIYWIAILLLYPLWNLLNPIIEIYWIYTIYTLNWNLLNVTRQRLIQQRVNNWSSEFSIFLRDMTWMLGVMPFFVLELLTLNEKKLSLVSSGESLVLIHEPPNLNHQILIINHSVPWLNLTSLGKQSPFSYFMIFDWLQILSRNLNITGKTVQQHKSRRVRLILTGSTWIPTQSPTFFLRRNSEISI